MRVLLVEVKSLQKEKELTHSDGKQVKDGV